MTDLERQLFGRLLALEHLVEEMLVDAFAGAAQPLAKADALRERVMRLGLGWRRQ